MMGICNMNLILLQRGNNSNAQKVENSSKEVYTFLSWSKYTTYFDAKILSGPKLDARYSSLVQIHVHRNR